MCIGKMEKLDVIVLGATGFSGKYIVKLFAKINSGVKWGIAGRSNTKLRSLVNELKIFDAKLSELPIIHCDANDKESLANVCKQTKLVVNCIGPYMETGYNVVEACIDNKAHYMDIAVEINYILDLSRKYHKLAEEADVLIIPACGLVAIIPVMGLMHLEQRFSGTLKSVECYVDMEMPKEMLYPNSKNCILHAGSLDTLLEGIRNMNQNQKLMKDLLPKIEEPKEIKRSSFHYRYGKFWAPNVFPDEEIANMSQKYLHEKEKKRLVPFKMYATCSFSWFFLIAMPFFLIFYILLHFERFRKLFSKYPRLFTLGYITHEGPLEETMKKVKSSLIFTGYGWSSDVGNFSLPPNKSMKLKVTVYDWYQATADAVVASTLTILKDSSRMPRGGVVNCGAAFYRTDILKKLIEFGIKYDIIDEENKKPEI